jgi:carbamoyltransferase
VPERIATIMAEGHPVAWFQGRMEFGPRALGGRSLGARACPVSLIASTHRSSSANAGGRSARPCSIPSPHTCSRWSTQSLHDLTFEVNEEWKTRAQVLERRHHPRWYDLMVELEKLTGNGVALNTSLNRRGEPMVCSPTDALSTFYGSDLQYLIMEDVLVVKEPTAQSQA